MFLKRLEICSYMIEKTAYAGKYPANIIVDMGLDNLDLDRITILYGNNGSGKTTILNIIAELLKCERKTSFYKEEQWFPGCGKICIFDSCVEECSLSMCLKDNGKEIELPTNKKFITSDDIFKFSDNKKEYNCKALIDDNEMIEDTFEMLEEGYYFRGMQDYERLKKYNRSRSHPNRYIENMKIHKEDLLSNGETALKYYIDNIEPNGIYLLDEPENCLSPIFQLELRKLIIQSIRYNRCQFIISTHSPFFLSLPRAVIYDLDKRPVSDKQWTKLENMKIYYNFFKEFKHEFERTDKAIPFDRFLTDNEFNHVINYLTSINASKVMIGKIKGDEELAYKTYYLLTKYQDLSELDIAIELGIIKG